MTIPYNDSVYVFEFKEANPGAETRRHRATTRTATRTKHRRLRVTIQLVGIEFGHEARNMGFDVETGLDLYHGP